MSIFSAWMGEVAKLMVKGQWNNNFVIFFDSLR